MTLREFLNTSENISAIWVYKIHEGVHTAFDPVGDTDLVYYKLAIDMKDIPKEYLDAKVQLWTMTDYDCGIKVCIA